MPEREIHPCECPGCRQNCDTAEYARHRQMNLLLSRLDEQQRRWYAAIEAEKVGRGGIRLLSLITGLDEKTITRGRQEMAEQLHSRPTGRIRHAGGGRPVGTHRSSRLVAERA